MQILSIIIATLVLFEVTGLIFMKLSVNSFAGYWMEAAKLEPREKSITYVALGDSASQGIGATHPSKGFVGTLAKMIQQETGQDVHIINLSVSGAGIQDVIDSQLPQLKSMVLSEDAVVTLSIGANDLTKHDQKWMTSKFEELLKELPPQAIVADIAYFGGGRFRKLEPKVVAVNYEFSNLISKYNFRQAKLHEATKNGENFGVHSFDYLHPSSIGYKNWTQAFWDEISLSL